MEQRRCREAPGPGEIARPIGTKAQSDEQLVTSWVTNLNSEHTKRNFELTARRFLAELGAQSLTLRTAAVEDVRDNAIVAGQIEASGRQTMLRVKSLLSYVYRLGYLQFNAGAMIRAKANARSVAPSASSARSRRDRILIEVGYAGGLRVSELVGLSRSSLPASTARCSSTCSARATRCARSSCRVP